MGSPRWSVSMLLASLIFLYWTTSSATSDQSAHYRINRDLPTDEVEKTLQTATDTLSMVKDVMKTFHKEKLENKLKTLANFLSVAPGVGTAISSVISMVLIFIPQEDAVLNAVKEGFAEVNRKLDSLSIQISNLATDVEWFNYVSVYSQDEVRILNAWKKFEEFFQNHSFSDFNHSAEIFVNYYDYTQTEASVANLYHYLTVSTTSLSGNINDLLRRKFKCDLNHINEYNLYFSTLLWKGVVLNEVYWKLTGFDTTSKQAEHAQMFKKVHEAHWTVVELCLNNSEKYIRDDVEELAKALSPENKNAIAKNVKNALDKKYSWYNWVVLVYEKKDEDGEYIFVYNMTKVPIGDIIVAVGYARKASSDVERGTEQNVRELVDKCFKERQNCDFQCNLNIDVNGRWTMHRRDYVQVTHAAYKNYEFVVFPPPAYQNKCLIEGYTYEISMHTSIKLHVCKDHPCKNNGQCKQLLNSNKYLCVCQDGYYGDTCDKKMNSTVPQTVQPLLNVTTTKAILKRIESTTKAIVNSIESTTKDRLNSIESTTKDRLNRIESTTKDIVNSIESTTKAIVNSIKSTTKARLNSIESATRDILNSIESTTKARLNSIESTTRDIMKRIEFKLDAIIIRCRT